MSESETTPLEVMPAEVSAQIEAVSRAEIDVQISTARKYPRKSLAIIKSNMMSAATIDEETAAACFYKLPRGGGMIDGPSVRLAEIAAANYGNMRVATRALSCVTDGPTPHVVIQAAVHDLENNLAVQVEKRRRITGKKSKGGKPDEDDINLATNACASIAFRDAVFRVVPNVLITPVLEACKQVAVGKATSLSEKRGKILARLRQMGVSEARVLQCLGVAKVDDLTLEHLEDLIGRGTALKDGGTVEEIFPVEGTQAPATAPAQQQAPAAQQEQPAPAKAAPKRPTLVGEEEDNVPMGDAQPKAAPAPAQPAPATPQSELGDAITSAGYTFDQFIAWGRESGNLPETLDVGSFDELPKDLATRLNRSKVGITKALSKAFPK